MIQWHEADDYRARERDSRTSVRRRWEEADTRPQGWTSRSAWSSAPSGIERLAW